MIDLNEIAVFTKVAQEGSFTKASKALGMPMSTVSRKVSLLEERLGVTLIQRTTRKLSLTDVGAAYLQECAKLISGFENAEVSAVHTKNEPHGLLRITAPSEWSSSQPFGSLIDRFMFRYPKVKVELLLTDRFVDLVGEGVDVAIRAGELDDSSLIARKLGSTLFTLVASPAYLKRAGAPEKIDDLPQHNCLHFTGISEDFTWELFGPNRARREIRVQSDFFANSLNALLELSLLGRGIALLPSLMSAEHIQKGRLKPVLSEWTTGFSPIHAVYPAQKFVPAKVTAFVEAAAEAMHSPEWQVGMRPVPKSPSKSK